MDPGNFVKSGSRPDGQNTALTFFYFAVYRWGPMVSFSKDPEGVQLFQGGGGGQNANFYRNS